jgi:hypothetical protein
MIMATPHPPIWRLLAVSLCKRAARRYSGDLRAPHAHTGPHRPAARTRGARRLQAGQKGEGRMLCARQ